MTASLNGVSAPADPRGHPGFDTRVGQSVIFTLFFIYFFTHILLFSNLKGFGYQPEVGNYLVNVNGLSP